MKTIFATIAMLLGGCALAEQPDARVSQIDESHSEAEFQVQQEWLAGARPVETETVCPFVGDCYIEHQGSIEEQNSYCRIGCVGPAICTHILQGECQIINGEPVGHDGKLAHSLGHGGVADPLSCYIIGRCERSLGAK